MVLFAVPNINSLFFFLGAVSSLPSIPKRDMLAGTALARNIMPVSYPCQSTNEYYITVFAENLVGLGWAFLQSASYT